MLSLLIVFILGLCYSRSLAPGLTWAHFSADGGDLISAAATGGVPHPTGYPLYLILARGFQLLPFGNLAFRTNIFSALCTILTALLLYAYLSHQLPAHRFTKFVACLAAIAYGLAPFVWGQALVTEVYALHGLLVMLCLYMLRMRNISEWFRGFVFGVAATNHLTALLMFPLLLLGSKDKLFVSFRVFVKRFIGLIGSLSLYLILPIRAHSDPPINWGDASTLDGFFWLVSGRLYHQYPFSLPWTDLFQRMRAAAGLLLDQYTWLGTFLGIYGLSLLVSKRKFIPVLWVGAVFLMFSIAYGSSDSQVNLLPFWLAFAFALAYGLQDLLELFSHHDRFQGALLGVLGLAILIRAVFLFSSVDATQDSRADDFIKDAMRTIPQNSLVFVEGDEPLFALWYARFALNQRADIAIVAEGLLPYSWYAENLGHTYRHLAVPAKDNLQAADLSTANPGLPVCYISLDKPIICLNDP